MARTDAPVPIRRASWTPQWPTRSSDTSYPCHLRSAPAGRSLRSSPLRPAFPARARGEAADRMHQAVDIVGRGGKGGDETDDTWLPTAVVKAVTLVQKSVDDLLGQATENDVSLWRARKASAENGLQPLFEPRGHGIGVPGIAQPQIVGEVGVELGCGETHLGGGLSGPPRPEAALG